MAYYALMSNDIKDPLEALAIYRLKDLAEKAFHNLKERLSLRPTSVSSEQNLEGKLFVQFLALIYLSYISKAMMIKAYKQLTMHELLDELDMIECFEYPGYERRIGEVTKKQMELYEAMVITPPTSLH